MAFDTSKLTKLAHLQSLAQRTKQLVDQLTTNSITTVKVNGAALTPTDNAVNVTVATGATAGTLAVNGTDVAVNGYSDLAGKVNTLIGTTEGDDTKSARAIAAEEVARVVADAPDDYDTLLEIAQWITNDTTGAAKMANDITALKTKTTLGTYDNEGTQTEYATVRAYVEAATGAVGNAKADKVATATAGHFAGLDASGNLTDSGKAAADFVEAEAGKSLMLDAERTKLTGISENAKKVEASTTNGNIKIDDVEVTVYTAPVATDAEVAEMLTEIFGLTEPATP